MKREKLYWGFAVGLVAIVVLLASCAALPPAKPIKNFEAIAGTWKGTCAYRGESLGRETPVTMIVKPDGTYEIVHEYIVPSRLGKPRRTILIKGGGKLKLLKDGKVKAGIDTLMTLHEGDGKRVISTYDPACLGQLTKVK